ncbi:hypothetical protein ES703_44404 [subsurface metagenome]
MGEGMDVSLGKTTGNPVYEYIKKEDIEAAFRDALVLAFAEITARIEELTSLYAASAPPSLWVWDFSSRWGYDKFW